MTKKVLTIALIAICFGYAVMAGPVMAEECMKMMGSMPAHHQGHLPDTSEGHACTCNPAPLKFTNSICASSKRNPMAAPAGASPDLGQSLAPDHADTWISQDKLHGSYRIETDNFPRPHLPAFILHQAFLC